MARRRHPNKEIESAIQYAEEHGWELRMTTGHAWAQMRCPENSKECRCGNFCLTSINTTPKNPTAHAKQIKRVVDNCKYKPANQEGEK